MERVSVSLNTPTPSTNGSGEAIHSWNSDQSSASPAMIRAISPSGRRAPTSWAISSSVERVLSCMGAPVAQVGRHGNPQARLAGFAEGDGPNGPGPLQPATFLVVAFGAFMQRRGQTRLDHLLGGQIG